MRSIKSLLQRHMLLLPKNVPENCSSPKYCRTLQLTNNHFFRLQQLYTELSWKITEGDDFKGKFHSP